MSKLTFAKTISLVVLSLLLALNPAWLPRAQAQTTPTVGFSLSPSVFPKGQSTSTLLCMSPLNTAGTLMFNQTDAIGITFDNAIGTVTAVNSPLSVHSSILSAADFTATLGGANPNKMVITYTSAASKQFSYTDTVCARVTFTSSVTVGSALVRYSSKFTGLAGVVGNLPYLSASIVDFPIGTKGDTGPQGIKGDTGDRGPQGIKGDTGPAGTSPDLSSVLTRLNALEDRILRGLMYVASTDTRNVSVIRTGAGTVDTTVPIGNSAFGVAINAAGTRVYVTSFREDDNGIFDNKVSVIDTVTETVVASVPVGNHPSFLAINPAGTQVYVTNGFDRNVSVIDTVTNTVVATVAVGVFPSGVAVNAAGTRVYVANSSDGTLSVIDTATNTVVATIPVGSRSFGVAVNGAGTLAYVTNQVDNQVSVIDTTTNSVVTTVPVGGGPNGVAINPAGTLVYAANSLSGTVSVIDTATNSVVATVRVGNNPLGVAVNAAGTQAYVTNFLSGTVSIIDTATNFVATTITVGSGPNGVAVVR